eukprot:gene7881-5507_t
MRFLHFAFTRNISPTRNRSNKRTTTTTEKKKEKKKEKEKEEKEAAPPAEHQSGNPSELTSLCIASMVRAEEEGECRCPSLAAAAAAGFDAHRDSPLSSPPPLLPCRYQPNQFPMRLPSGTWAGRTTIAILEGRRWHATEGRDGCEPTHPYPPPHSASGKEDRPPPQESHHEKNERDHQQQPQEDEAEKDDRKEGPGVSAFGPPASSTTAAAAAEMSEGDNARHNTSPPSSTCAAALAPATEPASLVRAAAAQLLPDASLLSLLFAAQPYQTIVGPGLHLYLKPLPLLPPALSAAASASPFHTACRVAESNGGAAAIPFPFRLIPLIPEPISPPPTPPRQQHHHHSGAAAASIPLLYGHFAFTCLALFATETTQTILHSHVRQKTVPMPNFWRELGVANTFYGTNYYHGYEECSPPIQQQEEEEKKQEKEAGQQQQQPGRNEENKNKRTPSTAAARHPHPGATHAPLLLLPRCCAWHPSSLAVELERPSHRLELNVRVTLYADQEEGDHRGRAAAVEKGQSEDVQSAATPPLPSRRTGPRWRPMTTITLTGPPGKGYACTPAAGGRGPTSSSIAVSSFFQQQQQKKKSSNTPQNNAARGREAMPHVDVASMMALKRRSIERLVHSHRKQRHLQSIDTSQLLEHGGEALRSGGDGDDRNPPGPASTPAEALERHLLDWLYGGMRGGCQTVEGADAEAQPRGPLRGGLLPLCLRPDRPAGGGEGVFLRRLPKGGLEGWGAYHRENQPAAVEGEEVVPPWLLLALLSELCHLLELEGCLGALDPTAATSSGAVPSLPPFSSPRLWWMSAFQFQLVDDVAVGTPFTVCCAPPRCDAHHRVPPWEQVIGRPPTPPPPPPSPLSPPPFPSTTTTRRSSTQREGGRLDEQQLNEGGGESRNRNSSSSAGQPSTRQCVALRAAVKQDGRECLTGTFYFHPVGPLDATGMKEEGGGGVQQQSQHSSEMLHGSTWDGDGDGAPNIFPSPLSSHGAAAAAPLFEVQTSETKTESIRASTLLYHMERLAAPRQAPSSTKFPQCRHIPYLVSLVSLVSLAGGGKAHRRQGVKWTSLPQQRQGLGPTHTKRTVEEMNGQTLLTMGGQRTTYYTHHKPRRYVDPSVLRRGFLLLHFQFVLRRDLRKNHSPPPRQPPPQGVGGPPHNNPTLSDSSFHGRESASLVGSPLTPADSASSLPASAGGGAGPSASPPPAGPLHALTGSTMSAASATSSFKGMSQGERRLLEVVRSADAMVPWEAVQSVVVRAAVEDFECPICLEPPIAPRITECGHTFCLPCVLHVLQVAREQDRPKKCPVCHAPIAAHTLKPALLQPVIPLHKKEERSTAFDNPHRVGEEVATTTAPVPENKMKHQPHGHGHGHTTPIDAAGGGSRTVRFDLFRRERGSCVLRRYDDPYHDLAQAARESLRPKTNTTPEPLTAAATTVAAEGVGERDPRGKGGASGGPDPPIPPAALPSAAAYSAPALEGPQWELSLPSCMDPWATHSRYLYSTKEFEETQMCIDSSSITERLEELYRTAAEFASQKKKTEEHQNTAADVEGKHVRSVPGQTSIPGAMLRSAANTSRQPLQQQTHLSQSTRGSMGHPDGDADGTPPPPQPDGCSTPHTRDDILRPWHPKENSKSRASSLSLSSAEAVEEAFLLAALAEVTKEPNPLPQSLAKVSPMLRATKPALPSASTSTGAAAWVDLYAESQGLPAFLHMLNMKMLRHDAILRGNAPLPDWIAGEILEVQDLEQTAETRKIYKAFAHVPIHTSIQLCLVDLSDSVLPETLDKFRPQLEEMAQRRRRREQQEEAVGGGGRHADPAEDRWEAYKAQHRRPTASSSEQSTPNMALLSAPSSSSGAAAGYGAGETTSLQSFVAPSDGTSPYQRAVPDGPHSAAAGGGGTSASGPLSYLELPPAAAAAAAAAATSSGLSGELDHGLPPNPLETRQRATKAAALGDLEPVYSSGAAPVAAGVWAGDGRGKLLASFGSAVAPGRPHQSGAAPPNKHSWRAQLGEAPSGAANTDTKSAAPVVADWVARDRRRALGSSSGGEATECEPTEVMSGLRKNRTTTPVSADTGREAPVDAVGERGGMEATTTPHTQRELVLVVILSGNPNEEGEGALRLRYYPPEVMPTHTLSIVSFSRFDDQRCIDLNMKLHTCLIRRFCYNPYDDDDDDFFFVFSSSSSSSSFLRTLHCRTCSFSLNPLGITRINNRDDDEMVVVRGRVVDGETRCEHYHSELDIIAIKFRCCKIFYPCFQCHEEETEGKHEPQQWAVEERDHRAILCGHCRTTHTIATYMGTDICPACSAAWNPRCAHHYHLYFKMESLMDVCVWGNTNSPFPLSLSLSFFIFIILIFSFWKVLCDQHLSAAPLHSPTHICSSIVNPLHSLRLPSHSAMSAMPPAARSADTSTDALLQQIPSTLGALQEQQHAFQAELTDEMRKSSWVLTEEQMPVVASCVERGADVMRVPQEPNQGNRSLLTHAVFRGPMSAVRAILRSPRDIDFTATSGELEQTPLHLIFHVRSDFYELY